MQQIDNCEKNAILITQRHLQANVKLWECCFQIFCLYFNIFICLGLYSIRNAKILYPLPPRNVINSIRFYVTYSYPHNMKCYLLPDFKFSFVRQAKNDVENITRIFLKYENGEQLQIEKRFRNSS